MLHLLRVLFVILGGLIGYAIGAHYEHAVRGALVGALVGVLFVVLELAFARRFIATASVVIVGVIFGFVLSHFVISALYLIPAVKHLAAPKPGEPVVTDFSFYLEFSITFLFCFISVIAILHTKDEFKIVIPFFEFARSGAVGRPVLLDTSAIIDGRVLDIIETKILDAPLVIPRFVLNELHKLSDSQDKLKRNRGRRGLEIVNAIREHRRLTLQVPDVFLPHIEGVDNKLINLAKTMGARILTSDFNLEKVAQVQGVDVINLHSLAKALKPPVIQGEKLTIELIKLGENPGQGVGFLEDGTMVVGEGCANRIGQVVELVVKNVIQTSAGRIIFGEPLEEGPRIPRK